MVWVESFEMGVHSNKSASGCVQLVDVTSLDWVCVWMGEGVSAVF